MFEEKFLTPFLILFSEHDRFGLAALLARLQRGREQYFWRKAALGLGRNHCWQQWHFRLRPCFFMRRHSLKSAVPSPADFYFSYRCRLPRDGSSALASDGFTANHSAASFRAINPL
jgi:hypothetical protein